MEFLKSKKMNIIMVSILALSIIISLIICFDAYWEEEILLSLLLALLFATALVIGIFVEKVSKVKKLKFCWIYAILGIIIAGIVIWQIADGIYYDKIMLGVFELIPCFLLAFIGISDIRKINRELLDEKLQTPIEGMHYQLEGAQKILRVYDDRISLEVIKNVRAALTENLLKGTKTIYYSDILGIQFKEASNLILGYIQFETAFVGGKDNFGSENSWTFDLKTISNEKAREVEEFLRRKISNLKNQTNNKISDSEDLLNWKKLLDEGLITREEFDKKKMEIFGKNNVN